MQEIVLTPTTVVLLVVILALAALAVHRIVKRGLCDCGDRCGGGCKGCSNCKKCGLVKSSHSSN